MRQTLKAILFGLGGVVGIVLLVGIPTELIPNPWFVRMMEVRPEDYVFLGITALLGGALAATYAFPAACPRYEGRFAASGFLTVLAVGCPICNKLVVLALGTTGAMTWFEPVQPLLALISVGLLAFVLAVRVRALRGTRVAEAPSGMP